MTKDDAHAAIARQVRAARSSFYWPMQLQSKPQREALFAIYAYARTLDDIADGHGSVVEKLQKLSQWREHISDCFSGKTGASGSDQPLILGLTEIIQKFTLPQAPFLALITGMETDVNGPVVAPLWSELEQYCAQVAGAVGELCLCVWGWRGTDASAFATATGEALQLTNILRDVEEDAANSRLYLPREALTQAGIKSCAPLIVVNDPGFRHACEPVISRAKQRFSEAQALWPEKAEKSLRPAWIMLRLYEALFNKILIIGLGPDKPRARLSKMEKVFHLCAGYLRAR
jgi:phytoene/squalene synthetase